MKAPAAQQRRVGLDKPCAVCGKPIYFNYKGPVEGLCGKCADRAKRKPRRRPARRPRSSGSGRRRSTHLLGVALVLVILAVGFLFARPFLPF